MTDRTGGYSEKSESDRDMQYFGVDYDMSLSVISSLMRLVTPKTIPFIPDRGWFFGKN